MSDFETWLHIFTRLVDVVMVVEHWPGAFVLVKLI